MNDAEQQTETDEHPGYAGFSKDGDDWPCTCCHDCRFAEGIFVGAALVWFALAVVAAVVLL